jgi:hypothetical protein
MKKSIVYKRFKKGCFDIKFTLADENSTSKILLAMMHDINETAPTFDLMHRPELVL